LKKKTPAKEKQTRGFTPRPSQNIVAYRPWSGRYAPCFSPTSPRFIRHRRRFGDVARLSKIDFKHYGAAIESLIIKIG